MLKTVEVHDEFYNGVNFIINIKLEGNLRSNMLRTDSLASKSDAVEAQCCCQRQAGSSTSPPTKKGARRIYITLNYIKLHYTTVHYITLKAGNRHRDRLLLTLLIPTVLHSVGRRKVFRLPFAGRVRSNSCPDRAWYYFSGTVLQKLRVSGTLANTQYITRNNMVCGGNSSTPAATTTTAGRIPPPSACSGDVGLSYVGHDDVVTGGELAPRRGGGGATVTATTMRTIKKKCCWLFPVLLLGGGGAAYSSWTGDGVKARLFRVNPKKTSRGLLSSSITMTIHE